MSCVTAPTFVALRGGRGAVLEQLRRAQFLLGMPVTTQRLLRAEVAAPRPLTLGEAVNVAEGAGHGVTGDGRSGGAWALADEAGEATLLLKGVAEYARLASLATAELVHAGCPEIHGTIDACKSGKWVLDTLPKGDRKRL